MNKDFEDAIRKNEAAFGLSLSDEQIATLDSYYEIVMQNNGLLHLVAPCTPETFATRHILESLMLLEYLPKGAKFADIGAGAGLPSIPCLLVRDDLRGVLIESSLKKGAYLQKTLDSLGLSKRAEVMNKQFEEVPFPKVDFVTSRALDKFTQKLPKIIKWCKRANPLFFGGNNLEESLQKNNLKFSKKLLPKAERSYIFRIRGT